MKQKPAYTTKEYNYSTKSGNLNAEAVGVVKGEKHFPVFEGKLVFKPLTKSKPFSGPLIWKESEQIEKQIKKAKFWNSANRASQKK